MALPSITSCLFPPINMKLIRVFALICLVRLVSGAQLFLDKLDRTEAWAARPTPSESCADVYASGNPAVFYMRGYMQRFLGRQLSPALLQKNEHYLSKRSVDEVEAIVNLLERRIGRAQTALAVSKAISRFHSLTSERLRQMITFYTPYLGVEGVNERLRRGI